MSDEPSTKERPLTSLVRAISDGRFLKVVFLGMLALTVATVGMDFREILASAPEGVPGSQRLEPAPMELPKPGDQTRTYLPKTMPVGPSRGKPSLPGYFGPLDSSVMSGAMVFHKGSDDRYSAIGTITPGTASRMREFLSDNDKQIAELYLHSPGGSVSDALEMARMLRAAGITTVVPANGYCASSCPLVLSGGLYRRAGGKAWVGVHQIYAPGAQTGTLQRGMADAQTVSALCQRLLLDMGVNPQVWIFAMQTPSASLYVLTPEQIKKFRLANGRTQATAPTPRPNSES